MVGYGFGFGWFNPRAPGPPPEKMVGVGLEGLNTEPEDMVGALGQLNSRRKHEITSLDKIDGLTLSG